MKHKTDKRLKSEHLEYCTFSYTNAHKKVKKNIP